MESLDLSCEELKSILDLFAKKVNLKKYEKMPYDTWRKMSKVGPDDWINVEWDNHGVDFLINDATYIFPFGDNGFGDFVDRYFIDDWERWYKDSYHYHDFERKCENLEDNYILYQSDVNTPLITFPKSEPSVEVFGDVKVDKADFDSKIADMKAYIDDAITNMKNTNNEKEISTMKGFNFDFGPVNGNAVRMSMYGLAVKNKVGTFVSYDTKSGDIMDVDVFNFEGANFLYKMPVAFKDIAIGDVVIHHNAPMFVVGKSEDGKGLVVVDVIAGERKEVMLAKSPFGFNFATKVVNFLGNAFNGTASAENPFGNMWMLFALSGENRDMKDMLPFMLMANGGIDMSNPMALYALMGDTKIDPIMLMAMSGALNTAPANTCNCGGNCGSHN